MIDPSTIQRIKDTIDIVDVVKDYVSLKKRGANYLGLCPFHNEKTPSFTVSASKGMFKCFGCGKAGDAIDFIKEHEHLSYVEAIRLLAKKYHIEIVEKPPSEEYIRQQNERESLLIINRFAAGFFTETLRKSPAGLAYFKERGIRDDMIERFQLGYCPDGRDVFTRRALQEGYRLEYLIKSGLTIQPERGEPFDRFRGRVIFPINSLKGNVLGFAGRTLRTDKNIPKYLNSPTSEIYDKSQVLYGVYQARNAIEKTGKVYLVEGYIDVVSLHQCGIENVVASGGTSLTVEQIRLIKRYTKDITFLYDGDEAGIKASLRGIDMVLKEGMNLKILLLPDGEDPDSYFHKVDFRDFIEKNESDFIDFMIRVRKDAQNDPIKRANLIKDVVRSIASIPDPVTRSVFIQHCSEKFSIDVKTLRQEMERIGPKIEAVEVEEPHPEPEVKAKAVEVEEPHPLLERKASPQEHEQEEFTEPPPPIQPPKTVLEKKSTTQNWDQEISELEQFFNDIPPINSIITLNQYTRIIDAKKFINSHLTIVKAQNGNPCYRPYLESLQEFKKHILLNGRVSHNTKDVLQYN